MGLLGKAMHGFRHTVEKEGLRTDLTIFVAMSECYQFLSFGNRQGCEEARKDGP